MDVTFEGAVFQQAVQKGQAAGFFDAGEAAVLQGGAGEGGVMGEGAAVEVTGGKVCAESAEVGGVFGFEGAAVEADVVKAHGFVVVLVGNRYV